MKKSKLRRKRVVLVAIGVVLVIGFTAKLLGF